jgi:glycosyltransferase involved in cell wall biosynthesis
MKIVMVDDCAYVGQELRKELIKRGFEVDHYFFSKSLIPKTATLKMAWKLRRTKHDMVHAHFCRSAVYAAYLSGKPYIAHCHGTDIRSGISWPKRRCLKKARKVLVSTPDLLKILPDATWLPNPIATERFKPLKQHDGNKVLYFHHWYEDLSLEVRRTCEKLGYSLTIPMFYSVPYERLHLFLNDFDIFVDRYAIKSYSKTALEAMACGLVVIGFEDTLEEAFEQFADGSERKKRVTWQNEHILPRHNSKTIVNQLIEIYNQLAASPRLS